MKSMLKFMLTGQPSISNIKTMQKLYKIVRKHSTMTKIMLKHTIEWVKLT